MQDAVPALHLHLPAAMSAATAQVHAPVAHLSLALEQEQLSQVLALADVAAQRLADLADAAAAAAADAGAAAGEEAKKDNGWLQPLVTALETVLNFIEVGAGVQWRGDVGRGQVGSGDVGGWVLWLARGWFPTWGPF